MLELIEKESNMRRCLICEELTRYAHMEIDACRACSVFYRRLLQRKQPVVCRTGRHDCETTRTGNLCCKKCRYDRFVAVLSEGKKARSDRDLRTHAAVNPSLNGLLNGIRRASELSTRPNIVDQQGIFVDRMVVLPSTYGMFNQNTRILISAIYECASTSFKEFKTLAYDEQVRINSVLLNTNRSFSWLLVRNFYPFICVLETEYRMLKLLPEQETIYTTYLDHDTLTVFLSDTPDLRNSEEGMRFIAGHLDGDVRQMRAKMRRWNPSEDEFIAFLGICFRSIGKVTVSDAVRQIADNNQQLLFLELDKLYRNEMGLDDYASRMGDAMLIISDIESCFFELRSKVGVLKLLDVIGDEMLLAQLHL